jgi:hypothetical protein
VLAASWNDAGLEAAPTTAQSHAVGKGRPVVRGSQCGRAGLFFLQVLILSGFKPLKMEVLILKRLLKVGPTADPSAQTAGLVMTAFAIDAVLDSARSEVPTRCARRLEFDVAP